MGEGEERREPQRVTSRRRGLEDIIYVQRLHLLAFITLSSNFNKEFDTRPTEVSLCPACANKVF